MQKISTIIQPHIKPSVVIVITAICTGVVTSIFLQVLDVITNFFQTYQWLLYTMPLVGIVIYWLYKFDANSHAGNNAIIAAANHQPTIVSKKMWWQVLLATWCTHLVGGSAGREGTAVQISGSLATSISNFFSLPNTGLIAYTAIAAGFSAVFGTPITAAFFAIEVVAIGNKKYHYLPWCLLAAYIAHFVCITMGAKHTVYQVALTVNFSGKLWLYVLLLAIVCGCTAYIFNAGHALCKKLQQQLPHYLLGIALATAVSLLVWFVFNTTAYFGLGVQNNSSNISMVQSFHQSMPVYAFAIKLALTIVVLSFGFKGGEVTPLFFIGAMLGNAVAQAGNMPFQLFAAIGFVAVFAAASNTILACILLSVELFGFQLVPFFIVAIPIAYFFSGTNSMYATQMNVQKKICIGKWLRC
jgi:H+/Cl- antiporter ClcA